MLILSVNPTGKAEDVPDEDNLLVGKVQTFGIGGIHDDLPTTKLYSSKAEFELKN